MLRRLALLGCLAFAACAGHAWATWRFADYELQLASCRGDAEGANRLRDQLLSSGRFVRQYDKKTGVSVYTFKKPKRH